MGSASVFQRKYKVRSGCGFNLPLFLEEENKVNEHKYGNGCGDIPNAGPVIFFAFRVMMRNESQPKETFYDGYIVNSVLDAAYKSAKTKQWEPVKLDIWRGKTGVAKDSHLQEYDKDHYLVKEETTHYGAKKVILKNKKTGKISEKVLS